MPKNDKQARATAAAGSRAEQVRSAVEGAFQAAGSQIGRDRAIDLADELAAAAHRVREALEELRPPTTDDLKRIGARLSAIERRLGALEGVKAMAVSPKAVVKPARGAARSTPARAKAANARAASKPASSTAAKPKSVARAAAKPTPAAKPKPRAAAKPKPAARAAAKPKPAAKPRPAR